MVVMRGLRGLVLTLCLCVVASMQGYAPELDRLEEFIKLSRSNLDDDYLKRTSGCIQNHILQYGDRGSPRRPCKKMAATVAKDLGIVRTTSSAANTCQYSITSSRLIRSFTHTVSTQVYVAEINIKQSNCTEGWTSAAGKSFFRLEVSQAFTDNTNVEHVATSECRLATINAAEYTYHCPVHSSVTTSDPLVRDCNALCGVNVTAVLDYEHYCAFDEVVGLSYGLNKVVIDQPLPALLLPEVGEKNMKRKAAKSVNLRCCSVKHRIDDEQAPSLAPPAPDKHVPTLHATTALRTALDRFDAVYFVGASHMRYLWDTVVHAHYNASALLATLPQHHADEQVENLWFVNNYFSMELPALLKDLCTPDSPFAPPTTSTTDTDPTTSTYSNTDSTTNTMGKVVFVIQTGSWDLDFNPAQNILLFPNSSTAVVQALVSMTQIDKDGEGVLCNGRKVEVVWLTSVPIPECEDTDHHTGAGTNPKTHHSGSDGGAIGGIGVGTHRKRKDSGSGGKKEKSCFDKGYRNNYAIKAVNQYFVRELERFMYPTTVNSKPSYAQVRAPKSSHSASNVAATVSMLNLHIIDAFDMIYPHRNDNVCGLHYLCCKHYRKERVEMLASPGGERLVDSVLSKLVTLTALNG